MFDADRQVVTGKQRALSGACPDKASTRSKDKQLPFHHAKRVFYVGETADNCLEAQYSRIELFAHRARIPTSRASRLEDPDSRQIVRLTNKASDTIDDYAKAAVGDAVNCAGYSGKQCGDPVRAAHADRRRGPVPASATPSLIGNAAYDLAMAKLDLLRKEFSESEAVSRGADFPKKN